MSIKGCKAQIWYADFTIALLLFLIATAIYFQFTDNLSSEEDKDIQEMVLDLKTISNALISEGFPENWTSDNLEVIGLTDGNYRIDNEKLIKFSNLNHSQIINSFNTPYNFYFYLEDQYGNNIPINGKGGIGYNSTYSLDRVQITRIAIYNSSMVKMVIHLWK